jgi:hypothetical protein
MKENTRFGSIAINADPMSGSMLKILKAVGLEKDCRNSPNFTISVETNFISTDL